MVYTVGAVCGVYSGGRVSGIYSGSNNYLIPC